MHNLFRQVRHPFSNGYDDDEDDHFEQLFPLQTLQSAANNGPASAVNGHRLGLMTSSRVKLLGPWSWWSSVLLRCRVPEFEPRLLQNLQESLALDCLVSEGPEKFKRKKKL